MCATPYCPICPAPERPWAPSQISIRSTYRERTVHHTWTDAIKAAKKVQARTKPTVRKYGGLWWLEWEPRYWLQNWPSTTTYPLLAAS